MNGQIQTITITPEAVDEIRRIRVEQKIPEAMGLRIGVKSSGCCGVSYVLGFDTHRPEIDQTFEIEGLKVYIDRQSYQFLIGSTLYFIDGPDGKGFYFENSNDRNCKCDGGGDCCQ
ncbi:MAG: iron-sulfur cluster assembly accessory protein [Bacteroidetes bacterium]|nr:iron-sulfur cluster assembly accessory protein [Bacteroidota bacterium]